jgi:hypothetical protein
VNKNVLLAVIQPTDSEIAEAEASFNYTPDGPLDVIEHLPYLVMVRRAYRAGFYTDTLSEPPQAANSQSSSTRKPKRQPRPRTTTQTARSR